MYRKYCTSKLCVLPIYNVKPIQKAFSHYSYMQLQGSSYNLWSESYLYQCEGHYSIDAFVESQYETVSDPNCVHKIISIIFPLDMEETVLLRDSDVLIRLYINISFYIDDSNIPDFIFLCTSTYIVT